MNGLLKKRYRAFTFRFSAKTNILLTPVHISLPYNPSVDLGKAPPDLVECRAIWDTGATNSVVTKNLAKKIGLVPTGKEKVTNTSSVELQNSYLVNLYLPNKVVIPYLKVTECEDVLGGGGVNMLIGMDVIGSGGLAITYEDDKTVMSFVMPPIDTIDYVPVSESENRKSEMLENFQSQKQKRSLRLPSKKVLRDRRKKERQNRKKYRRK